MSLVFEHLLGCVDQRALHMFHLLVLTPFMRIQRTLVINLCFCYRNGATYENNADYEHNGGDGAMAVFGGHCVVATSNGLTPKIARAIVIGYIELVANGFEQLGSFKLVRFLNVKLKQQIAGPTFNGVNPSTNEQCVFRTKPAGKIANCLSMKKFKKMTNWNVIWCVDCFFNFKSISRINVGGSRDLHLFANLYITVCPDIARVVIRFSTMLNGHATWCDMVHVNGRFSRVKPFGPILQNGYVCKRMHKTPPNKFKHLRYLMNWFAKTIWAFGANTRAKWQTKHCAFRLHIGVVKFVWLAQIALYCANKFSKLLTLRETYVMDVARFAPAFVRWFKFTELLDRPYIWWCKFICTLLFLVLVCGARLGCSVVPLFGIVGCSNLFLIRMMFGSFGCSIVWVRGMIGFAELFGFWGFWVVQLFGFVGCSDGSFVQTRGLWR